MQTEQDNRRDTPEQKTNEISNYGDEDYWTNRKYGEAKETQHNENQLESEHTCDITCKNATIHVTLYCRLHKLSSIHCAVCKCIKEK